MSAAANRTPSVPFREDPSEPDRFDGQRKERVRTYWHSQDGGLRQRDRQVEENLRMLAGQQWLVWHPLLQRYFDLTDILSESERRWRQRPVTNLLIPWFILTHARLTENPPILTFLPGPDRIDAELAEVMDELFKHTWRDIGMTDAIDRLMTWVITAGQGYLMSSIDPQGGPWVPVTSEQPIAVPIFGPDGQPVGERPLPGMQVAEDGTSAVALVLGPDGQPAGLQPIAKPKMRRQGQIRTDVLSPMQVRGEWGPTAWHKKRWHQSLDFMTPEQVYERWGVEVEPDFDGTSEQTGSLDAILNRVLFGQGYFGSASGRAGLLSDANSTAKKDLVRVWHHWEAPVDRPDLPEMQETPENPGGRYTVLAGDKVLYDGPRPVAFRYTSNLRLFEFVRVPGRPSGSTPLETMLGPQRSYNKLRGQILEHTNLVSNPKFLIDKDSGIKDGQWTNEPGVGISITRRPNVPAVEWLTPPAMGSDVYRALDIAREELLDLGNLKGTQGEPVSPDQSGEAIKELRFNSDRFIGPTARRAVEEIARLGWDWLALMPLIYDEKRVMAVNGEDNVARTITVYPLLFEQGTVNIVPDTESMLPEGRGERQSRIYRMWQDGAFGDPMSPQAIRVYLEQSRFPHLGRAARPGGVDRTTAEQENGKLLLGDPVESIPVLEWYDHITHLDVHESYMKSPEYLKQSPEVQQAFELHRALHLQMLAMQMPPAPTGAPGGGAAGAKGPPATPALGPGAPTAPSGGVPGGAMPTAPNVPLE